MEIIDSNAYEKIRVGLRKCESRSCEERSNLSVNPDQLGTDIRELSERKPSTV